MKELLGMLIGLAKATFNNLKTEDTDQVILKGLVACKPESNITEKELDEVKALVQNEKRAVAPGCATCMSRCGNTDDYDWNKVLDAPEEIRKLKVQILDALIKRAEMILETKTKDDLSEESMSFFYRALYVLSEDWEEQLIEYAKKSQEALNQAERTARNEA